MVKSTYVSKLESLKERFWSKVDKRGPDECWEWDRVNCCGYGSIRFYNKRILAHRVSVYLHTCEWPPEDKLVCHRCNNRGCVNPAHLYIGTPKDNTADMIAAGNRYSPSGENNGGVKLNEKKVRAIREIYKLGDITHKQLARLYEVSQTAISEVINNKSWKHIV